MTLHFTTVVKPFVWNLLEKRMNEPVFCGMIEIDGYFWAIWLKAQSATGSKYSGRLQVTGHRTVALIAWIGGLLFRPRCP
jgi:hypothetical protein